ncbi:MAG: hypothetical protein WDW38_010938 [Sanguina aurantia]
MCAGADAAVVDQALPALRRCSKALMAASDSARSASITLHPCHISNAIPHLSKLTGLTGVTVCASPADHTLQSHLHTLHDVAPDLTPLTLTSGCGGSTRVRGIHPRRCTTGGTVVCISSSTDAPGPCAHMRNSPSTSKPGVPICRA